MLVAWRLQPLVLGAFFFPLEELRNISGDTRSLVFRICNIVYSFIPALSTAAAFITLVLSWACFPSPDHG